MPLPLWNSFTPVLTIKYQAPLFPDILLRWTQSLPHLTVIPFLHSTKKELNTYLASADAVIDGSQKRYNKSHELLLDSIRNNQATITATATLHLTNDGASWKLENAGTELGNAIFGTLTASPVPEDSTEDNE